MLRSGTRRWKDVDMLAAERRAMILALASEGGAVRIGDLVDRLGVSHVTVRRDLEGLVAEGALDKVRGGAVLSADANDSSALRGVRSGFSGTIGVVVPTSYYYRHVVDGIGAALEHSGAEMKLVISDYDLAEERRLVAEAVEDGAAGILMVPSVLEHEESSELLDFLAALPVPVVLIERELPGGGLGDITSVRSAHERGVFSAMRHLHDLGHRRVAMVSRGRTQSADFVRAGWVHARDVLGFDAESSIIGGEMLGFGPTWERGGSNVVLDAIESTGATALFSHGDENSLFLLLQAARARGLSVPEDLSIVAYDDEVSAHADPPLSAIAPDRERVGELATRLLVEAIERPSNDTPLHIQVEPRLLVRSSTAAPRARGGRDAGS
ncbi:DeoR family transcriptional regulator [Labedella gwakjiensis]|uniref:DeoR family transcriptional regulator n=2 Tax=Labedella gwakjiensis TaxID=390269 RepID=A0ABY0C4Q3_9MICO|nr:DeoR family transcriptional regulator [Labedella gwakjiensis]